MEAQSTVQIPRVAIRFCTQCKWNLRAAYYAQELLQTFSTGIGEISLIPVTGGIFTITLYHHHRHRHDDDEDPLRTAVDPSLSAAATSSSTTTVHQPAEPTTLSSSSTTMIDEIKSNDTMIDALQLTSKTSPPSTATATNNAKVEIQETLIWDRKRDGGFPETKELKNRIRNIIDPQRDMGHIDRSLNKAKKGNTDSEREQGVMGQNPSQGHDQSTDSRQVVENTRQIEAEQQLEAETKAETAGAEKSGLGNDPQQQHQHAKPRRIDPSTGKPAVECEDCQ